MESRVAMSRPATPQALLKPMIVPPRELFGPGPSNMSTPVQLAGSRPLLGHLHPEFVKIMADTREGLQYLFKTRNAYTFAVSGTGHAGMEAALINLLEHGEKLLVVQTGIWGVEVISVPEGHIMEHGDVEKAITQFKPNVLFVCQGDSSTGICQPIEGLGKICHENQTLLLVDTVASIGGTEFEMDSWGVDCVYSAPQKVLNAPPGLAPISFSDRAITKIKNRKTPVASWYFDALELGNYWGADGQPRRYHHTAPISTVYALREALALVAKEGIDELIARHRRNAEILYEEVEAAGLACFVSNKNHRLPCLTTIQVPANINAQQIQAEMMAEGIEIAGGLGSTVGLIWRIGTFGINSDAEKIRHVVRTLGAKVQQQRLDAAR